jgi:hypothetical protein
MKRAPAFVVTGLVLVILGPKRDPMLLLRAFVVSDVLLYLYYLPLIWVAAGHPRNRPVEPAWAVPALGSLEAISIDTERL